GPAINVSPDHGSSAPDAPDRDRSDHPEVNGMRTRPALHPPHPSRREAPPARPGRAPAARVLRRHVDLLRVSSALCPGTPPRH
ncbi:MULTISPECIES: hypothetical protein, partial [unclassified Streptomyces]|uniref:hypothetical protein n=1 Tax=unclassified Streptomyces TaxID=2593676 RepID=UPI001C403AC8